MWVRKEMDNDKGPDRLFFRFQQLLKRSEGFVDGGRSILFPRRGFVSPFPDQVSRVFIVVAVKTQQFPVAAVKRVVLVVVILVVDREFAKSLSRELTPASPADPREQLEGAFPVGFFELGRCPLHCHDYILRFSVSDQLEVDSS
jgi:hypothetical protein